MSKGFWILFASILASSLVFIDGTVVSIALPIMQTQLHASASDAQWVVEGYTLILGSFMLLAGALADRYGRKRIFIIGVSLFALASMWVGLSPSIGMLLVARVFQGLGGTLLAPASLAMLGAHFQGEERGKAVGTWSALTAVAATIGPVLGGVIIDHFSWRWVFFLNAPLAALVLYAAFVHVDESKDESAAPHLDIAGSALITLALGGIVYAFIAGGAQGWKEPQVYGAAIAGVLLLIAFIFTERGSPNPILPLKLFAGRTFSGVQAMTLLLYAALGGLFYFLPFVLIRVYHYSGTQAGLTSLPFIILMVALSRFSGALIYRLGAKMLLTIGPIVTACGFALFAVLPHDLSYWAAFFPGQCLVGLGMGLTVAPLTTTMMEAVKEHRIGLASGINSAVARIAGLLAIAVLGALLAAVFNVALTARMDAAHLGSAQRDAVNAQRQFLTGATLKNPQSETTLLLAYDDGFRAVAWGCAVLAVCSGLLSALLIEKKPTPVDV